MELSSKLKLMRKLCIDSYSELFAASTIIDAYEDALVGEIFKTDT